MVLKDWTEINRVIIFLLYSINMVKGDAEKYKKSIKGKMTEKQKIVYGFLLSEEGKFMRPKKAPKKVSEATEFAKSIKGKMSKAQETKYRGLIAKQSKGFKASKAKNQARLDAIRARKVGSGQAITIEETDANTYMKYEDAKKLGLKEVEGKRGGLQRPKQPKQTKGLLSPASAEKRPKRAVKKSKPSYEVRRPAFRREVRDVKGTRPKLVPDEPTGYAQEIDPTDISTKAVSKAQKKKGAFFRPEFIQHASYGMGRGGDPTELEIGMPSTTTGGEAFVMDEGRTELHHRGATEFNEEYANIHNQMLMRQGETKLLRKPRIDLLLTESTMEGQNIDRGKDPDNPVSFEGTKGRGLSRPQKAPPMKVNTLEKTLRKGGYLMENEVRSSKVNLAGEQIIKGRYSNLNQPRMEHYYRKGMPIRKLEKSYGGYDALKIQMSQQKDRGECGDGTKTCSEFYVMVENSAPEDAWNMNEGDYGKSKQKQIVEKAMPKKDIDAYMNRPDSKARFHRHHLEGSLDEERDAGKLIGKKFQEPTGMKPRLSKKTKPSELDYQSAPTESKQLLSRDDLRITEFKGKPLSKFPASELRRLAQTKGIPTTTKTERSGDFAPAKLGKANLIKKLNIGLPRDMDYDFFDTETSTDEVRRVYESGIADDLDEDALVDLEDETLLEFGNYAQYSNAPDAYRD